MNFTSSSTYFHIKYSFSNSFIQFKWELDWASFSEKYRGLLAKTPQTQRTPRGELWVDSLEVQGRLCKLATRRGRHGFWPLDLTPRISIRWRFK